jgi:hypothetical protein
MSSDTSNLLEMTNVEIQMTNPECQNVIKEKNVIETAFSSFGSSKFDEELIVFTTLIRQRRYTQKPRVSDALRRATLGKVNIFSIFEPQRGSIMVRIRS